MILNTRNILLTLILIMTLGLVACGSSAPATDIPVTQADSTSGPTPATSGDDVLASTETQSVAEALAPSDSLVANSTVSFNADILPILQSRCVNCHGGQKTEKKFNMTSHASLMQGSENGAMIIPGDAENSKLISLIAAGKMPKRGPKITPDQLQLLMDWVNAGALDN